MKKEGWEYKKLGEVCEVYGGTTPSTANPEYWNGNLCWISPAELDGSHYIYDSQKKITEKAVKEKSLKLLPIDSVVFSSRAPIGKLAINKVPLYFNQGFKNIICGKNIYCEYLYRWMQWRMDFIKSLGSGATFPEVSKKVVENLDFFYPSLREQEKIVAYLDGEFERIEKLKANAEAALQHTKDLFQSTLKQLLTPKPNWEEKELEKTCSHIVDCPHTTPVKSITKTIYPCIRTSELKGGEIFWDSMQYVEEDEYKKRVTRLIPQENDIVYGREGTFGDAVLLPKGYNFCLGQRTMLLRANTNMISPCFLLYQIISPFVYNQACEKNVGCGVPHVNVADVKKFKISFPPLAEQQAIVSRLDTLSEHCRKLEQNYRDTLSLCDDLKQALLREVFE